jgi:hypothetical protein
MYKTITSLVMMGILCAAIGAEDIDVPKKDRKALGIALASIGITGAAAMSALAYQNRSQTMVYKDLSFRSSGAIAKSQQHKTEVYRNGWNRERAVVFGLSSAILICGTVTFLFN